MQPITPFEVPDLRRLVTSGQYFARKLSTGRIELVPANDSAGLPIITIDQRADTRRLEQWYAHSPSRRRRRR